VRLDERPVAETAVFLCCSEQEVREKIAELEHGASTARISPAASIHDLANLCAVCYIGP
jgi:hypothetical protein